MGTTSSTARQPVSVVLRSDVVAAIDQIAEAFGVSRTRALAVLLESGLGSYEGGEVPNELFIDAPKPLTTDELLEQSPTPRLMLAGLAERGGAARLGELGQMAGVGNTSRWKWQERLVAHGLITRDRQRATLTADGWTYAERLRLQERTAA